MKFYRLAAIVFFTGLLSLSLVVTAAGAGSITLAWDPSTASGVVGYNVFRTETAGSFLLPPLNGSTVVTGTTFTDSTVQNGKTYYYAVTAVGASGQQSSLSNSVQVVVASSNQPPSVSAGTNQTITLPASALLSAAATDDGLPMGTLSYQWSVTGAGATIMSPNSPTTLVTFATGGLYTFRVTVSDGQLASSSNVSVTVQSISNQAPVVNAGADKTIEASPTTLAAVVSDDGRPTGTMTYQWSVVYGTGVNFTSSQSASTQVSFLSAGTYTLRLTVSDGQLVSSDDIVVTLKSASNAAPTTSAGPDISVTLPSLVSLAASATDDGLPGGLLTYQWTVIGGSGVDFSSPRTATTQASFASAGVYTVRVTVSDGQLSSNDDVVVTVRKPTNVAPSVNAGPKQTGTVGTPLTLNGSATDDGLPGGPLKYQWSVIRGGDAALLSAQSASTQVKFGNGGTYTLRLTVSDGELSSSDEVDVTVKSSGKRRRAVSAGQDLVMSLASSANLTATVTEDETATEHISYQWSVIDGAGLSLSSPQSASTKASSSEPGTYLVRVTVTDGDSTVSDEVVLEFKEVSVTNFLQVPPQSASPPALGLSIMAYNQNSVPVSEAVFQTLPQMQNGRILAEFQDSPRIGLAFANPNSQPVTIDFYYADETGSALYVGQMPLAPGEKSSSYISDDPLRPQTPIDLSRVRSFTFSASAPIAVAAIRVLLNERGDYVMTALPIADLDRVRTSAIFPFFADGGGWQSEIQLINSTNSIMSGTIQLFPSSNGTGPDFTYSILPRSAVTFRTPGVDTGTRTGWVRFNPAAGSLTPEGSLIISRRIHGVTTSMGTIVPTPPSSVYHLYVETSGDSQGQPGSTQTAVSIVNPASIPAFVTLELLTMDWAPTERRGTLTIGPQEKVSLFLNQLPGMEGINVPFKGILRVSGEAVSAAGFLMHYTANDYVVSMLPAIDTALGASSSAPRFLFTANGNGFSTDLKDVRSLGPID